MSFSGELVYFARDSFGDLRVFDDGSQRTLAFGPGNEQSAVLKDNPAHPLFEYIQVMLLALLYRQPRKVLCLGLGAGSLISTLHAHCPQAEITAVELRQAVIDIARKFFYLPESERIRLHCQDAGEFVAADRERYDLIFSDLYTAHGLAPVQLQQDFLRQCSNRLNPAGLLVINCWHVHQGDGQMLRTLRGCFSEIRLCPTGDGNWVLFAGRLPLESRPEPLRERAISLSALLGYSLLRHLKQLQNDI